MAASHKAEIANDQTSRIPVLDAMRGSASFLILLGHLYLLLPVAVQGKVWWLMAYTPLRFGFSAVIGFFMLSGFVLALPYFGPRPPGYTTFLIKRFCRLYLPFVAIIVIAVIMYTLCGVDRQAVNDMTLRVKASSSLGPFTPSLFARTLLLTGQWGDMLPEPSMWTLVYELRVALFFPLLVWLCRHTWLGLALMGLCYATVFLAVEPFGSYIKFPILTEDYASTWLTTIYITPCFMMGIFLARFRDKFVALLARQSVGRRRLLWLLTLINLFFIPDLDIRQPFTEIGAAMIILLLLSSPALERLSRASFLQWLGKISFSLYLIHLPVVFILSHLLSDRLSIPAIYCGCVILTLPLAALSQHYIERPALALGQKLAKRMA